MHLNHISMTENRIRSLLIALAFSLLGVLIWQNHILENKLDQLISNLSKSEKRNTNKVNVDMDELHTDSSYFWGNKDAKVSLVLFNSFSCGFCNKFRSSLYDVLKKYPKDLKVIYKHFNRNALDNLYAQAIECAAEQGGFLSMYDKLFQRDAKDNLKEYSRALNLNQSQFDRCIESNKYLERTKEDTRLGRSLGVRGTPSYLINQKLYIGYKNAESLSELIQKEL